MRSSEIRVWLRTRTAPAFGTPTGYNWEIQPDGVAQGGGVPIAEGIGVPGLTDSSGAVLAASTSYELYIQTDCGGDGTSGYVQLGFTTLAGPPPANDDFANAADTPMLNGTSGQQQYVALHSPCAACCSIQRLHRYICVQ